jgi:AbrB family looped-hinge helix DNA binding protein
VAYSKVTKKGQITIPSHVREQHGFSEGVIVAFKEGQEGIIIEPVRDITESAGKLSKFATADAVIRDLLRTREQEFR